MRGHRNRGRGKGRGRGVATRMRANAPAGRFSAQEYAPFDNAENREDSSLSQDMRNDDELALLKKRAAKVKDQLTRLKTPAPVKTEEKKAVVDHKLCTACRRCLGVCPLQALSMRQNRVTVDASKCSGCGLCVAACPQQAISLKYIYQNIV